MYRIWIDCDEEGYVTGSYSGHHKYIVPPDEEYDYYFESEEDITQRLHLYQVIDGKLNLI